MTRLLLSLTLVLTQVAASGGSPLFLCLSHNGAVCIDFGPEACDCCDASTCSHESCSPAECGHSHGGASICDQQSCEPESSESGLRSLADDCGCKHVQISAPQNAVSARASSLDIDSKALLGVVYACLPTGAELLTPLSTVAADVLSAHRCPSLALSASAVMRC